jgi:hypothetical protein
LYEYLLKFPVEIVREVSIDEIKEGKLWEQMTLILNCRSI